MFSIQQLIKSTRKLQASSVSGVSSADLAKNLKHAAAAGNGNYVNHYQQTHLESGSVLTMTSSLSAPDMTPTSSSSSSSSSSSPQQQQTNITSQQQSQEEQNSNELKICQRSKNTNTSCYELSLCSHLNESGSPKHNPKTSNTNTQEQKLTTTTNNKNTNTKTTAKASRITSQHFCNRSQQIQNFYQQQLHQFHTQANQSLWAKQKQTHFTMSSLAAAEPLSTLKSPDDIVAAAAATTSETNGDNGVAENSTTSVANKGKICFKSGYPEILQFMELIGNLKHTKRTGWVLRDVSDCESISGHMYRMSMMTFLLDGTEGLNQIRCMELALVHDLAESIVGDLTPFCGISKEEKRAMEFKAMDDICKLIEPRGKRIMELFVEYEAGESAESKFVKDLDRLDMVMQAFEYEKRDNCLLKHQEFFDSTEGKFKHPFVQQLVKEIYAQRTMLANETGAKPPPNIVVPDWEHPAATTAAAAATSTSNQSNGHCSKQQPATASELQEEHSSTSTSTS